MNARFTWTSTHSLTTAVSLAVLLTMGCARSRVVQTDEVLVAEGDARKAALKADAMITGRAMIERVLRSEGDDRTIDVLIISGGGDFGAFGAAFLRGWSEIDGDGGITSNILYGGLVKREQTAMYRFNQLMPDEPKLKMRYWVLLNNQARTLPHTTQPTWPDVIARSIDISIRASTLTSLRHLFSFAEVLSLHGDGEVEVRWIGIPNEWRAPVEGIFEKETMNNLADLGYTMGKDPSVWNSEAP